MKEQHTYFITPMNRQYHRKACLEGKVGSGRWTQGGLYTHACSINQNPIKSPSYINVKMMVLSHRRSAEPHLISSSGIIKITHSLSRTSTNGNTSPTPNTKLSIFATRVFHPASKKAPPNSVEPMYPALSVNVGEPPSTIVAPPTCGSIVILRMRPPESIACHREVKSEHRR